MLVLSFLDVSSMLTFLIPMALLPGRSEPGRRSTLYFRTISRLAGVTTRDGALPSWPLLANPLLESGEKPFIVIRLSSRVCSGIREGSLRRSGNWIAHVQRLSSLYVSSVFNLCVLYVSVLNSYGPIAG
ncbi:hypothetical protein CEXT_449701 [Caerostris extrusa]|uniref:Secreted protein n=1 Tax=Caerostris extrusa TaxID=172846 RepID=A0AAV4RB87_CAEEX|nr:hypothetical protein CEXT_449701 [Caerostris extrusa]